jgi:hypothetical protein
MPDVVPPLVPKTKPMPDGWPFGPRRKTPGLTSTDEDTDPTTTTQPLRNGVEQVSPPALLQDWHKANNGPLEEPAVEQPHGAVTECRSPIVPSPPRPPLIVTSAVERHAQNVNFEGRRKDEDATSDAATSIDTSNRDQSTPPTIPAPPRPSARTAAQEPNRVGSHERSDSTIQVNIGRIEVRALFPPPPALAPVRRAANSALSLADYFKERDRGAR